MHAKEYILVLFSDKEHNNCMWHVKHCISPVTHRHDIAVGLPLVTEKGATSYAHLWPFSVIKVTSTALSFLNVTGEVQQLVAIYLSSKYMPPPFHPSKSKAASTQQKV